MDNSNRFTIFIVYALLASLPMCSLADNASDSIDDATDSVRVKILQNEWAHYKNEDVAQWLKGIDSTNKSERLKAAYRILLCAYFDKDKAIRKNIGDQVASRCDNEPTGDLYAMFCAALVQLGHPSITNILARLEGEGDDIAKGLARAIRERKFLNAIVPIDPVVINDKSNIKPESKENKMNSDLSVNNPTVSIPDRTVKAVHSSDRGGSHLPLESPHEGISNNSSSEVDSSSRIANSKEISRTVIQLVAVLVVLAGVGFWFMRRR